MPASSPFMSFGHNAEDVVLHRALGDVTAGRYVELGAGRPTDPSPTRAFYDRGWHGLVVPADAVAVEALQAARPRDTVALATGGPAGQILDEHLPEAVAIHFLVVGTADGADDPAATARAVLAGVDLRRRRPWVLVVTTAAGDRTRPVEPEKSVLEAGYEFCSFDGVSSFYVAAEHAERLRAPLSSPASVLDDFVPHRWSALEQELTAARDELAALKEAHEETLDQLVRWRGAVLARWADAVGSTTGAPGRGCGRGSHEVVHLKEELAAMQATVSWRITAPLRAFQRQRLRAWR